MRKDKTVVIGLSGGVDSAIPQMGVIIEIKNKNALNTKTILKCLIQPPFLDFDKCNLCIYFTPIRRI